MLGVRLGEEPGLGLLPVTTAYSDEKLVRPSEGETTGRWLLPAGLRVDGYEIHLGRTAAAEPLVGDDGAVRGLVAGPYFHGLLDSVAVRAALVGVLRARRGLDPVPPSKEGDRLAAFDAAADVVEQHLDLRGLL
jgi:adenosylcobyric acid synthase